MRWTVRPRGAPGSLAGLVWFRAERARAADVAATVRLVLATQAGWRARGRDVVFENPTLDTRQMKPRRPGEPSPSAMEELQLRCEVRPLVELAEGAELRPDSDLAPWRTRADSPLRAKGQAFFTQATWGWLHLHTPGLDWVRFAFEANAYLLEPFPAVAALLDALFDGTLKVYPQAEWAPPADVSDAEPKPRPRRRTGPESDRWQFQLEAVRRYEGGLDRGLTLDTAAKLVKWPETNKPISRQTLEFWRAEVAEWLIRQGRGSGSRP